jgi:hypothetical protein
MVSIAFVLLDYLMVSIQNIILAPVKTENADEYYISDKIKIANIQELNTKVRDEVNYQDYVLETAQITLDDVPTLTDQYAPVEKLLNPLSSKPYNVEEQANNKLSSLNELEDLLAVTFPLPIVIAAVISVV